MRRFALHCALTAGILPLGLAGCGSGYSPNTYAASAAQEEAAVQRGIIIGVRQITISPDGTIGAATGGAIGGVAGSQVAGAPVVTALGAIGGTLVGGIGGAAAAQAVGRTKGWEYIVQETDDKLVSVTQTSRTALPIGLHVLVIAGAQQARIVPDYTVQIAAAPPPLPSPARTPPAPAGAAPAGAAAVEIDISPALPAAGVPAPSPPAPVTVATGPASQPAPAAASATTPATAATSSH